MNDFTIFSKHVCITSVKEQERITSVKEQERITSVKEQERISSLILIPVLQVE